MLGVSRSLMVASLATLAVLVNAGLGEAQTFRFQLKPFCNKVTLSLVQSTSQSVVGIVGYDDNCGENPRAPIHGTAVLNPNGSITLGYTTSLPFSVYQRTDVGLQTSVELPANSNVGSWTNDDGESGTFVFDILDQPSG
jgi:hypothetical protein